MLPAVNTIQGDSFVVVLWCCGVGVMVLWCCGCGVVWCVTGSKYNPGGFFWASTTYDIFDPSVLELFGGEGGCEGVCFFFVVVFVILLFYYFYCL